MRKILLLVLMLTVFFNVYPDTAKDVLKEINDIIEENKDELKLEDKKANLFFGFYPLGFVTDCFIFEIEKPIKELNSLIIKFGSYNGLDERDTMKYEIKYRKYSRSNFRGTYAGFFGGYLTTEKAYPEENDNYYEGYKFDDGPYIGMELGYKRRFIDMIYMSNGINFGYKHGSGILFSESRDMFFALDLFKISVKF